MESNSTLFKEAIAEAKAVREAAIANAKAALEETITPRLSKLIANKLNELEEEDKITEEEKEMKKEAKKSSKKPKDEMPEDEMPEDEMPEDEMPEDEMPEDEKPEDEETDIEVGDMDIPELESFIAKAVRDELQAMGIQPQGDVESGTESGMESNMEDSDDINLEELLAELELEEIEDEPTHESHEEEPDIEDILQELKSFRTRNEKSNKQNRQLTEALKTINTLKRDLTEVNLLNAKLLYLSKLMKNHSLSESQVVNIMASFDKATTTAEAKLVYESTNSSLSSKAKVKVNESRGFASRPTGNAPKRVITESVDVLSTDVINRFQILAGIKKPI
jgi:hypothetical protein